jgi:hypothetical protein
MGYYDIQGARGGGANNMQDPITAQERQYRKQIKMIKSAERANYDGSVEVYQQVKALALQLGIPIKEMKTSGLRKLGVGGYSLLDTALLGLLPNNILEPVNKDEEAWSSVGQLGGMILPWGMPAKLARGAFGAAGAYGKGTQAMTEGFKKGFGKYGWNPFGKGSSPEVVKEKAKQILIGPKAGPAGTGGQPIKVPPGGFGHNIDKTGPNIKIGRPGGAANRNPNAPNVIKPNNQLLLGPDTRLTPEQLISLSRGKVPPKVHPKILIDKARNNLNQINKGKLEVIARQVGINNGSRMTAKALRERILNLYKSRLGVNAKVNPSAIASYPRGPVQGNLFT